MAIAEEVMGVVKADSLVNEFRRAENGLMAIIKASVATSAFGSGDTLAVRRGVSYSIRVAINISNTL
jgi:hypothetical protein